MTMTPITDQHAGVVGVAYSTDPELLRQCIASGQVEPDQQGQHGCGGLAPAQHACNDSARTPAWDRNGMLLAMVRLSRALEHKPGATVDAWEGQCVEAAMIELAAQRLRADTRLDLRAHLARQREEVCAAWHALPDQLRQDQRLTRLYYALGGTRMDDPAEADTSGAPPSGLTEQLATAVEAIEQEHDPLCMAVLRGKDCTCGVASVDGAKHG